MRPWVRGWGVLPGLLSANCGKLVCGDRDLLEMEHPTVRVRSPRETLAMINDS